MSPLKLKWYDVYPLLLDSPLVENLKPITNINGLWFEVSLFFFFLSFNFLASWAWTKRVIQSQNIFWLKFDAFASVITHLIIVILIMYKKQLLYEDTLKSILSSRGQGLLCYFLLLYGGGSDFRTTYADQDSICGYLSGDYVCRSAPFSHFYYLNYVITFLLLLTLENPNYYFILY